MSFSKQLEQLLMEVADICDSGVCYDMRTGADHRYDKNTYGVGLSTAYQAFIATKEGAEWYDGAIQENHREVFGDEE